MLRVVAIVAVLALGVAGGWFGRGIYYGDDVFYSKAVDGDLMTEVEDAAVDAATTDVESISCKELVRPVNAYNCVIPDPRIQGLSDTIRVVTDGERVVSAKNLGFQP